MSEEKIENILKLIAKSRNLKNYEIGPYLDVSEGAGFLSRCYTGEIMNKDDGSKIQTFIKISLPMLGQFTSSAYSNEYHFYTSIFPELNKFQTEKSVKHPFQNLPEFYCGNDEENEKYIAMENLNIKNYSMTDKTQHVNKDNLKALFEIYGKFHALSAAYKEQNSEKYLELTKPLKDLYVGGQSASMLGAVKHTFSAAYNAVKEIDTIISKKFTPILENFEDTYVDAVTYNGKYSGLSHGDCWSNNMLFKYGENGKVVDIKIIDFQLCRDSTPINDLSYFFYSGGSKEEFKKLDEYLELYYKSFSAFAKELGSDPNKILPLSVLKSEWKKYSLMGIFMAILLWQSKLVDKDKIKEFSKGDGQGDVSSFGLVLKSDAFKKNTSDILLHAAEYGIV